MTGSLAALVVMPLERRSCLIDHLTGVEVRTAASCGEATDVLRLDQEVRVVLTDLALPDGSWFDILNLVGDLHPGAHVVVCARVADERLWTQVLEAGGFDVLVEPYQEREVHRILEAATVGHPPRHMAAARAS